MRSSHNFHTPFHREREDEEAARRLAEELEREEELQRQVRAIRDEQLARRLQNAAAAAKVPRNVSSSDTDEVPSASPTEPICRSMR